VRLCQSTRRSLQGRRWRAPAFRKTCLSRFHSHVPQSQPVAKSTETCFEGPFGEVIRTSGPMAKANPFRFSTKYQDDETDLLYYGHRYLKSSTGGWPNRDPLRELGHRVLLGMPIKKMRPDNGNLYGFTHNNPVNWVDIDGRDFNTPIELCNRQIENPTSDFILGCCNMRGHDFYRWPDGNGGYGSVGFQDPHGKDGDLPKSDHPENARTCQKCEKNGGKLKYGSGSAAGKSSDDASDAEIQDCLKNRPIKGNYGGLRNNCNDWAGGAAKDCGLTCNGNPYLVK